METEVMDTTVAVQELTEKVLRLEEEVAGLRQLEQEVAGLRQEVGELKNKPAPNGQAAITDHLADKEMIRRAFDQFLAEEGIQAQPIGVEKLREMMMQANLEPNELSRDLIAMRDE
jgi:hypothetical protein